MNIDRSDHSAERNFNPIGSDMRSRRGSAERLGVGGPISRAAPTGGEIAKRTFARRLIPALRCT
jgi:hypothetical protein